ncbi:MAG: YgfZ/GcvT domain-containing protein [Acidimicrobiales bacterium]
MSAVNIPVEQLRLDREVIEAVGPDTERFLQGQLSQDVVALAVGASTYSLLLAPQGKVDALLRITRTAEDRYLLDVDAGWGEAVLSRLGRFKLRTKCQLTLLEGWTCWAVRGGVGASLPEPEGAEIVADACWPVLTGFDRLGPDVSPQSSLPVVDTARYDEWRVAAGVPAMGAELDEHTIPAEAGRWLIEHAVSFTKGCYTGQELVARIDSRGSNTPRRLRRLVVTGPSDPAVPDGMVLDGMVLDGMVRGAAVHAEGAEPGGDVGAVTTVGAGGRWALAYCKRAVEPGATVRVGAVSVRVEELPAG